MKLNRQIKFLILLFTTSIGFHLCAQENVVKLNGIVKKDSTLLKDINIINKTKSTGSSSNIKGEFVIYASLGDSILFSSVNYSKRLVIISETHIQHKKIIVYLEEGFNELDEIMLNQSIKFNTENIYIHPNMTIDNDQGNNKAPPNIRKHVDPLANSTNGISVLGLAFKIADELFLKKRRLRRKKERKEHKIRDESQLDFINTVVSKYDETFFTEELNIHPDKVYIFIDYCEDKGIKELYNSNEFVIKNFFIKQSIEFNKIKP